MTASEKKKLHLFLFAAHHNEDNIAAQRFRGLLRYLDTREVAITVLCAPGSNHFCNDENIEVITVPGTYYRAGAGWAHLLLLMLATVFPRLLFHLPGQRRLWAFQAARHGAKLVAAAKGKGHKCVVMGTFCPLDAVIAAAATALRYRLPNILDFRDGLGFESFGMQGRYAVKAKKFLEKRLCRTSQSIVTVSTPLEHYFAATYPQKPVVLLPNGIDPEDLRKISPSDREAASRLIARYHRNGEFVFGHFGRISGSDPRAIGSLRYLVNTFNDIQTIDGKRFRFVFMGELTPEDHEELKNLRCGVSVIRSRPKPAALAMMSQCDALLLLTSDRRSVVTGKLYDYLAVGGRLLHLALAENEAHRLLLKEATGQLTLDISNEALTPAALQRFMLAERSPAPSTPPFSKPVQARRLRKIIDDAATDC